MTLRIESNQITYAVVYDLFNHSEKGANFLSDKDSSLQISVGNYDVEHGVARHSHLPNERISLFTEELLFIFSGSGILSIYDDSKELILQYSFSAGMLIHLLRGGHELTFTQPTKLIEVKQGPYVSRDKDKTLW